MSGTLLEQYQSELPELLETNRGEWIAYGPRGRIAINKNPDVVYRKICDLQLKAGEYLLACIESEVQTEIDV